MILDKAGKRQGRVSWSHYGHAALSFPLHSLTCCKKTVEEAEDEEEEEHQEVDYSEFLEDNDYTLSMAKKLH